MLSGCFASPIRHLPHLKTRSDAVNKDKSGLPRLTPMANVLATSRCGCVLTTGKSKLRRANCARSSFTSVELKDEVRFPTTEWSSRSLFLNAEGRSKPSFNGETLVKRALLKK